MRSEDFHTKKKERWKPETNKKVVKKTAIFFLVR